MAEPNLLEPNARLPLRWGAYLDRYVLGIAFIVGGGLGLQGANPRVLPLLLAGTIMHAAGWAVLPSPGWRRVIAAALGTATIWLLLMGPTAVGALALPFAGWMLVRQRPWRAWVGILFPIAYGIAVPQFVHEYRYQPIALGVGIAVLVGSAWLARGIARATDAAIPSEPEDDFR